MTPRRIRHAARAIVLDQNNRVLLTQFDFGDRVVWAPPGGGLDEGETHEEAVRRELAEELALTDFELGPCLWFRDDRMPGPDGAFDAQVERHYLVRTDWFDPEPRFAPELWMTGVRWWTIDEIESSGHIFAPRRLAALLRRLVAEGPPPEPIDVGV